MITKDTYLQINKTFKKKLVFRLGGQAGFYSEFNNMVICMAYCLEKKIRFYIHNEGEKIFIEKGWEDYFIPFYQEKNWPFLKKYNVKPTIVEQSKSFLRNARWVREIYGINYLTQDIFDVAREKYKDNPNVKIDTLNYEGDILDFSSKVIKEVYRFNPKVRKLITEKIQQAQLPKNYASLHIRRGDKISEADLYGINDYFSKLENNFKNIHIYTGDYRLIKKIKTAFPQFNFFYLNEFNDEGYDHSKFMTLNSEERFNRIVNMLANVEISCQSNLFVGSFDSNLGMFVGMRKAGKNCLDVKNRAWFIM